MGEPLTPIGHWDETWNDATRAILPAVAVGVVRTWHDCRATLDAARAAAPSPEPVAGLREAIHDCFMAGFAYGRSASGLEADTAARVGHGYAEEYIEVWLPKVAALIASERKP